MVTFAGSKIFVRTSFGFDLKGHSQLVHMCFRYHFLVDLHITLHHKSCAEKRILWKNLNKPCRVEVFASQNRPNVILEHSFS